MILHNPLQRNGVLILQSHTVTLLGGNCGDTEEKQFVLRMKKLNYF